MTKTLAALTLAVLCVPGQAAAQAKETVKETIGAWEIRCAADNANECVMAQTGKTADGEEALEMRVRKLVDVKTKDGKPIPAAVQIRTPLGSILPTGVRLKIDNGEPRAGLYEVCLPNGCVVRDALSEELLNMFKAGNNATLSFTMIQRGEVVTTVSLKGFTKAFGAL